MTASGLSTGGRNPASSMRSTFKPGGHPTEGSRPWRPVPADPRGPTGPALAPQCGAAPPSAGMIAPHRRRPPGKRGPVTCPGPQERTFGKLSGIRIGRAEASLQLLLDLLDHRGKDVDRGRARLRRHRAAPGRKPLRPLCPVRAPSGRAGNLLARIRMCSHRADCGGCRYRSGDRARDCRPPPPACSDQTVARKDVAGIPAPAALARDLNLTGDHLHAPYPVGRLAREAGVSRSHPARSLRRAPHGRVMSRRMARATHFLHHSALAIEQSASLRVS